MSGGDKEILFLSFEREKEEKKQKYAQRQSTLQSGRGRKMSPF